MAYSFHIASVPAMEEDSITLYIHVDGKNILWLVRIWTRCGNGGYV
jgi:hypothetical protein